MELGPSGEARFYRPDGRPLLQAPAAPTVAREPVTALVTRLASQGVAADGRATLPDWWGGPVDYAWEIDWLRSLPSRDDRHPASATG